MAPKTEGKYIHYVTWVSTDNPSKEQIGNFYSDEPIPKMDDLLESIVLILPLGTISKSGFNIGVKSVATLLT
jgi:hypothetical protein